MKPQRIREIELYLGDEGKGKRGQNKKREMIIPGGDPSEISPTFPPKSLPGVWDGREPGARKQPKQSPIIRKHLHPHSPIAVSPSASRMGRGRGETGIGGCEDAHLTLCFFFFFLLFLLFVPLFASCSSFFFSRQATAYARRHALGAGAVTQRP